LGLARTPTAPMAKKAVTMREKIIVKSNSRLKTLGKSSLRVLLAGFQCDFVAGFYTILIPFLENLLSDLLRLHHSKHRQIARFFQSYTDTKLERSVNVAIRKRTIRLP